MMTAQIELNKAVEDALIEPAFVPNQFGVHFV
jgi:hypothetical protein